METTVEKLSDDMFVMSSLFDSTFNSLIAVYSRCFIKEGWKEEPNQEQITALKSRFKELIKIERGIPKMDVKALYQAVKKYSPELRQMLEFEEKYYSEKPQ
jgi:hypothetical protein